MKLKLLNQYFTPEEFWKLRRSFLSVIMPRKVFNFILLYLAQRLRAPRAWGSPAVLMIEVSSRCNMACPMCPIILHNTKREKGDMSLEQFRRIIEEVGDRLCLISLWNFGEPLLNKDIAGIVRVAKQRRIFVAISTNGILLTEDMARALIDAGLDYLIISFDGATEKTYERYRGKGNYKVVLENIENLMKVKKRHPFVDLQFIVMRENENEIEAIKRLAIRLGVDKLSLKKFTYMDERRRNFLPTSEGHILSRYKGKGRGISCSRIWQSAVISSNGDVFPCCVDLNFKYKMGNVFRMDLATIWRGLAYAEFRKRILRDKDDIDICRMCPGSGFNTEMFLE